MARSYVAGVAMVSLAVGATALIWTTNAQEARAHCQVPCGIYDDAARIARMREDAATIKKATDQILKLSGKQQAQALNQAVRWINTKEEHASHIIEVVSKYFLTQKVKPVAPGTPEYDAYLKKLADHHGVMAAAMKTKQVVDPAAVDRLGHAIDALASHYQ